LNDTPELAWSKRFLDSLDAIGFGPRRPRRSTWTGQVRSLSLSTSLALALVRAPGTDAVPYRARIGVRAIGAAEWRRIERELAGQALYIAKLLSGELPDHLADLFAALDAPLFPRTTQDIAMDCTCPEWHVPCEHLSAVCWLLAEMFDTDPFQVLLWRGRTRTDLLERLMSLRSAASFPTGLATERPADRPLADRLDSFWGADCAVPAVRTVTGGAESVRRPDLLLDQVAPPNLALAGQSLVDLLRPLYQRITEDTG
jgi:uncharacterized Zn finger protein